MKRFIALISLLLLTACAQVPASSELRILEDVEILGSGDSVRVIARPPTADMTAVEIVEGFAAANASSSDNFAIARKYLTSRESRTWNIISTVVIDPAQTQVNLVSENVVEITSVQIGQLSSDGRLTLLDTDVPFSAAFQVVRTDFGWRIEDAPRVALMTLTDVSRNYQPATIYFTNTNYSHLVPEVVWLPRSTTSAPTAMMQTLLNGPGGTLKSALQTAIPVGTKMNLAAVFVESGRARVELNGVPLGVGASQKSALIAQIVWSLTSLGGINSVEITASGQTLEVDDQKVFGRSSLRKWVPDRKVIANPFFASDQGAMTRDLIEPKAFAALADIQSLAVSPDGSAVALVQRGVATTSTITDVQNRTRVAENIVAIDYDIENRLWLVTASGRLLVQIGVSSAIEVIGLDADDDVVAVAPAPDGARLAVVLRTPQGQNLRLFGINSSSETLSLTRALRMERYFSDVLDVDWDSHETLVAVARRGIEEPVVYEISLDAAVPNPIGGPAGITSIHAAFGQPTVVTTAQGLLWYSYAGTWLSLRAAETAAYAG